MQEEGQITRNHYDFIEHVYDDCNDENAIEDDEELSGCSLQFAPCLPCKLCAADIGREAATSHLPNRLVTMAIMIMMMVVGVTVIIVVLMIMTMKKAIWN